MNDKIVITGMGVISCIGHGKDQFWENLIAGKSGISEVESFDVAKHLTHRACEIKDFDPKLYVSKRSVVSYGRGAQLVMAATRLALQDAKIIERDFRKLFINVSIGTTLGEIPIVEQIDYMKYIEEKGIRDYSLLSKLPFMNLTNAIIEEFKIVGRSRVFTTACSAGNYAVGDGFDSLVNGECDFAIAGGADPFSYIAFTGFNQLRAVAPEKCQPFDKNRRGMMVGEGAGIVFMEKMKSALERKAKIYGEVLGYGTSCDAHHITQPQSFGIYSAMKDALQKTRIRPEDINYISAHGTGTRQNDSAESKAIVDLFGRCAPPVSSIKSMIGHAMGAASAMETIACLMTIKEGIAPPTINFETKDEDCDIDCIPNQARKGNYNIVLNNASAFGGNNACLVLKKVIEKDCDMGE